MLAVQLPAPRADSQALVMTMMSAMPMTTAMFIIVAIWSMILSLVTINIIKPIPTQIKVATVVAPRIPAMEIIISTQPPGVMVAVSDKVVPVVTDVMPVVTSVCRSLGDPGDEQGARNNQ